MPTILCIDDHTYGLASAIEVLRSKGYDVIAATSRAEALDAAMGNPVDVACLNVIATHAILNLLRHYDPSIPSLPWS